MSGVFRNIDPPPPSPPGECVPPRLWCGGGEDTLAGWRGGWGSIVRKTPDTMLCTLYNICKCFKCCKCLLFLEIALFFYLYVYTLFLSFLNLSPPLNSRHNVLQYKALCLLLCFLSSFKTFSSLLLCSVLSLSLSFSSFLFLSPYLSFFLLSVSLPSPSLLFLSDLSLALSIIFSLFPSPFTHLTFYSLFSLLCLSFFSFLFYLSSLAYFSQFLSILSLILLSILLL